MRRNYKKLTALLITSALLVSFAGCSKNAVQTDGSTGAAESDSISVSDNDTETVVNSTAEEETQEQSTEGEIEKSTAATDEADPTTEEETQTSTTREETSDEAETSGEKESSTDNNKETTPKETTEKGTTTNAPETTKGDVVAQSIKASVSGTHYIGDTLAGADITVVVTMSDGSKLTNPAGWSANPLKLTGASNQITVAYEGLSTTITVNASEKPAETTAAPQPTMPAPTTPAPPETAAPTKTYGLDAVPEGLEIKENPFGSTCLTDITPLYTNVGNLVYHYNDEPVSASDYSWMVTYQGNNGIIVYQISDNAKKNVTGLENIITPAESYRTVAYYKGIEFSDVLISASKGYRPDTYDDEAAQLEFALFNQERNSVGLNSFIWSDTLADLAKIRAKELESDYSHSGCFYGASEIITYGFNVEDSQSLARGTFASWKGSSGHYNIIVNHGQQELNQQCCGIAYYRSVDGNVYTVAIITGENSQLLNGIIERDPAYLK